MDPSWTVVPESVYDLHAVLNTECFLGSIVQACQYIVYVCMSSISHGIRIATSSQQLAEIDCLRLLILVFLLVIFRADVFIHNSPHFAIIDNNARDVDMRDNEA